MFRQNLKHVPDLLALSERWPAEFPFLLESSAPDSPGNCHSILFLASDDCLECGPSQSERVRFLSDLTDRFASDHKPDRDEADLPFRGGWFLFLGYEMGTAMEPTLTLPQNPTGLPDAFARRCPAAIIVVHDPNRPRAVIISESRELLAHVVDRVHEGRHYIPLQPAQDDFELPVPFRLVEDDPRQFCEGVRRIHEHLLAGDVFQVNLSRAWHASLDCPANATVLYRSLRQNNPAPFSGLVRYGSQTVLSSSPERLIEIRRGVAQTRPIAGTRPRVADKIRDQQMLQELIDNAKERAEHIMLIDLERNDLGRVCVPGSVEVNELMAVESHAHVHHIVSNVRGRLRAEASPVDAIRAVFPGGTITGCPKVRCMEIIGELEGIGRGYYTGSMGYLNRDGDVDMNILIRSMLLDDKCLQFRTGAGIVSDSSPERELEETREKARGLLLAIENQGRLAMRD